MSICSHRTASAIGNSLVTGRPMPTLCHLTTLLCLLTDNSIDLAARQDGIFVGLLDACVKKLQEQGMRKMFMDGVTSGLDNLLQLGEFPDCNIANQSLLSYLRI